MLEIGFHLSIAGGLHRAFDRAERLGCTTFQIFTGNPRSWRRRPISKDEVRAFCDRKRLSKVKRCFAHMPYLANFCARGEVYSRSVEMLVEEVRRCERLGVYGLVIHMGKLKGEVPLKEGLRRIAKALDVAVEASECVILLLENTAGQGTEVGYRLEHIEDVIRICAYPYRIGVCLDTAHAFQAGYPIHTKYGLGEFLEEFDRRIGLGRLKLVHLNDSRSPFASRVDRHWHIGMGEIGEEGFKTLLSHAVFRSSPLVMETPWGEGWDRRNIETVRRLLISSF